MIDFEVQTLLMLARATTQRDRREALIRCTSRSVRLPVEARHEIAAMLRAEATTGALRPLPNPVEASAGKLSRVEPGPDPFLPSSAIADIDEWCDGWKQREALVAAGCRPPGALLLSGPPGTGKSTAIAAIARRFEGDRITVCMDAHRIVAGTLGESTGNLTEAWDAATKARAVLALEELDGIGHTRDSGSAAGDEMARVTIALMRMLDGTPIPVIATTNRPDALDPALLRRCETEVVFDEPTAEQRARIVKRHLGEAAPDVEGVPIAALVPLAQRARRRSVLRQTGAVDEFASLVASWGSPS